MDGHLIAVEIGVEGGADQRMQADGLAFHQLGIESLDAQAMQGRGAVQQHRVIVDDLLENVPDLGAFLFHELLRGLDGVHETLLFQLLDDEGLVQLEGHGLGQAALVDLEIRAHHDHGTAGIIDALAEQVLAEAALLAFQQFGKRLERTAVFALHGEGAAAVVEQHVDGFLEHALFVAQDDFRGLDVDELLQPVVAVDDAAVEIVQIGGGETAAFEGNQRAQVGRDDRQHVQDHPLGAVRGLAEGFHDLEALEQVLLALGTVSSLMRRRMSPDRVSGFSSARSCLMAEAPILASKWRPSSSRSMYSSSEMSWPSLRSVSPGSRTM